MARATRVVKVFATQDQQAQLAKQFEVIEAYESFVLLRLTVADAKQLSRKYPLEDITNTRDIAAVYLRGEQVDRSVYP